MKFSEKVEFLNLKCVRVNGFTKLLYAEFCNKTYGLWTNLSVLSRPIQVLSLYYIFEFFESIKYRIFNMKIGLIIPAWNKKGFWANNPFKFPYLSLPTIASFFPDNFNISIIDENIKEIDFSENFDIILISIMTPNACRGYKIAQVFMKRGIRVILGGIHASVRPEEAKQYATSIAIGECEYYIKELISDIQNNTLKEIYKTENFCNMDNIPIPRKDLLSDKYLFKGTLQTTRGCPFDCEFCSVTPFFGNTYRKKSIDKILMELKEEKSRFIFFVDDNITGDKNYAKALFKALIPLKIKWLSQSSIKIADDDELLQLAKKSGCRGLFIGFESLNDANLKIMGKQFNKISLYKEKIKRIQDHGIGIQGSFIFGYDNDTEESFDQVYEFVNKTRMDAVLFSILTPFPGTRIYTRLHNENRILSYNWDDYDMNTVVFQPKLLSPEKLQKLFNEINTKVYSVSSLFKRLTKLNRSLQVFLPQNIGFRMAWKRSEEYYNSKINRNTI